MSDVDAIGSNFSIGEPKKIASIRDDHLLRGDAADTKRGVPSVKPDESKVVAIQEIRESAKVAEEIVNSKLPQDLAFSVEDSSGRVVVAVTEVGSDKVIRQFPPEEFLTVASVLAELGRDGISEEMLKGILYDSVS